MRSPAAYAPSAPGSETTATPVTAGATAGELYAELRERYRFSLPPERLRVAINAGFADWDTRLAAGDLIVFIPPVAGG